MHGSHRFVENVFEELDAPATVAGKVEATGDWEDFATRPMGTIEVTETGNLKASLRPIKKAGGAVMNICAILLRPS